MPNRTFKSDNAPAFSKTKMGDFYRLVEAFKTHREQIAKECRSRAGIGQWLHEKTGLPVTDKVMIELLDVCEVDLDAFLVRSPKSKGASKGVESGNDFRVLLQEIAGLFNTLGYPTSDAFDEVYHRRVGEWPGEPEINDASPPPKGVPVSSLPKPGDIAVSARK